MYLRVSFDRYLTGDYKDIEGAVQDFMDMLSEATPNEFMIEEYDAHTGKWERKWDYHREVIKDD